MGHDKINLIKKKTTRNFHIFGWQKNLKIRNGIGGTYLISVTISVRGNNVKAQNVTVRTQGVLNIYSTNLIERPIFKICLQEETENSQRKSKKIDEKVPRKSENKRERSPP